MSDPHPPDTPIAIEGYVTDPKFVGYQVVTNYEITYWQRLVGSEAWTFYVVLRSFCHKDNNVCFPSIRLLMDILGLTDRRKLIGREDTTPGKERVLPGLIDVLQIHGLAAAEIQGEGPKRRYVFHINLTPSLLTAEQLLQLPKLLQKKHVQLLEQIRQSSNIFADVQNKKPTLVKEQAKEPVLPPPAEASDSPKGGGTVPGGGWYRTTGGVVPYHPNNNNITIPIEHARANELDNNNSGGEPTPENGVVVALLRQKGISEKVALRLADRYSAERIREKIDFLAYLQEHDAEKVKNPQGWLRRAIEEDYRAPDGYGSPKGQGKEGAHHGGKDVAQAWLALIGDDEDEAMDGEDSSAAESG